MNNFRSELRFTVSGGHLEKNVIFVRKNTQGKIVNRKFYMKLGVATLTLPGQDLIKLFSFTRKITAQVFAKEPM